MKEATNHLKAFVTRIVTHPIVVKALHTFWQTALAVLLAGFVGVHDYKGALALAVAAIAAGLSAIKSSAVAYADAYRNGL